MGPGLGQLPPKLELLLLALQYPLKSGCRF